MDIVLRQKVIERNEFLPNIDVAATLKRTTDIVLATTMLGLASPLLAATAIAIKIDSPGPVIYQQERVGHYGKVFTIFKFRSMRTDAEANGTPQWASEEDPRITRFGRFMRKCRLDELPQLVNVIKGQMSLVGPRPERPYFVNQLSEKLPTYYKRLSAKPGITGWAQVNYPYCASIEDNKGKLAYDLYYVKNRSFWLDMHILLSTIRVVLSGDGAR